MAIIGSISLAARRAIIVRDPAVLEQVDSCQTIIFDKTGTLTYGKPQLTDQICTAAHEPHVVLSLVASLEQYSKHPLAEAIVAAGRDGGVILIDGEYAATYRLRDAPRQEGALFVNHLGRRHGIQRVVLLSGDRASEVQYLAELVGISEFYGGQSPEDKLEFVTQETNRAKSIFVGDGINDAPALMAATVGIAFGQNSDVTTEAAGVVIMDSSLAKVDQFMHISRRMRTIALQSAIGGMALSIVGMLFAAAGYLPPVAGRLRRK